MNNTKYIYQCNFRKSTLYTNTFHNINKNYQYPVKKWLSFHQLKNALNLSRLVCGVSAGGCNQCSTSFSYVIGVVGSTPLYSSPSMTHCGNTSSSINPNNGLHLILGRSKACNFWRFLKIYNQKQA